mmetsp:Transcript_30391/g.77552  ORF Transcript_30391/g.77552 Transcript_30391/m.77552 type:complete len:403 (+) Transcript_30391:505-1713(+)
MIWPDPVSKIRSRSVDKDDLLDLREPVLDGRLHTLADGLGTLVAQQARVLLHVKHLHRAAKVVDGAAQHVEVHVDRLHRRGDDVLLVDLDHVLELVAKRELERALDAHLHGGLRGRARGTGALQAQEHVAVLHLHHLHVAAVRHEVGAHLVQHLVHRLLGHGPRVRHVHRSADAPVRRRLLEGRHQRAGGGRRSCCCRAARLRHCARIGTHRGLGLAVNDLAPVALHRALHVLPALLGVGRRGQHHLALVAHGQLKLGGLVVVLGQLRRAHHLALAGPLPQLALWAVAGRQCAGRVQPVRHLALHVLARGHGLVCKHHGAHAHAALGAHARQVAPDGSHHVARVPDVLDVAVVVLDLIDTQRLFPVALLQPCAHLNGSGSVVLTLANPVIGHVMLLISLLAV